MNITELAVRRPTLIVVVFSILTMLGLFCYSGLNYELIPKINSPVVNITTLYPGASPSEVESTLTRKIENEVSAIENVDKVQSVSMEGVSIVTVTLNYGTDVDAALQSAQRKVNGILSQLPEGVKEPTLGKFSLNEAPILTIAATSAMEASAFTDVLNNKILPQIGRVEGVGQVAISGNEKREININVNSDKLKTHGLSIIQVSQALASANMDFPTGDIKNETSQTGIRLAGKLKTIDDVRNLTVALTPQNSPIYIKDIAEVVDGSNDPINISRLNGKTSVGISVSKQGTGNAVEVSKGVRAKLEEIKNEYQASNLNFAIASDSSTFTLEAASAVIHDLGIAVILVAVIMLFFLHSIRNAFIVMVSIPLSIVATFIAMHLLGYSLNLMSLLALSLVVGILVDDSIVVLENIYSHMERGANARTAAIKSWNEIGFSVASITLVIVVVFLPITFVTDLIADLLKQFVITVSVATIISLIVSFTVTPLLASRFSKVTRLNPGKTFNQPFIWFEKAEKSFKDFYHHLLIWSLKHKRWVLGSIFIMVISSFALLGGGFIGSEFVNQGDNGEFTVELKLRKDATIGQTNRATIEVENVIRKHPEVAQIFTTVGSAGAFLLGAQNAPNKATINVKLVRPEKRNQSSAEYAASIKRELFQKFPGIEFKAKPLGILETSDAPIQVVIQGLNLDSLIAYSEQVKRLVRSVPGASEVESSVEGGNSELSVNIDRSKMADLGLSVDMVGATLQNSFAGNRNNKFSADRNEYDINIQLDAFDRSNRDDILNINFMNRAGQLIKLSQFASVASTVGPTKLERQDKVFSITIKAQVFLRPSGTVGQEVQTLVQSAKAPEGISIKMGGDLENQAKSFASLGTALAVSIVLIYLIMVALYESYLYPLIVMFSVPVAIIGALLALALARQNMSIFAMLGLIMLLGLVVKNAILIVDYINHLKKDGRNLWDAVVEGTMTRFRPVLMTTIAMIIAMIPVAVTKGAGAEWKNGLAWILIGGLTSSMLLTFLIVPIMYYILDSTKERFQRRGDKSVKKSNDTTKIANIALEVRHTN